MRKRYGYGTLAAQRHRLIPNLETEAVTTDLIIAQILKDVPRDAGVLA